MKAVTAALRKKQSQTLRVVHSEGRFSTPAVNCLTSPLGNKVVLANMRVSGSAMGGGTFSKMGGTSARQKNYRKFLRFELATATSQALKYEVISYTPYDGINYTILDKITPFENVSVSRWDTWNSNRLLQGRPRLFLLAALLDNFVFVWNYSKNGNCPWDWISHTMFHASPLLQETFSSI